MIIDVVDIVTRITIASVAFFVAWQANKHFKVQRSLEYIRSWNSIEIAKSKQAIDSWIRAGSPPFTLADVQSNASIDRLVDPEGHDELTNHCKNVANFYTELSLALKRNAIDEAYTFGVFQLLIPGYYEKLEPFFEALHTSAKHQNSDEPVFKNYRDLYLHFKDLKESGKYQKLSQ